MTTVLERLHFDLAMERQMCGRENILKRFVIDKGRSFVAQPFAGKRMKAKQCFSNALHYALEHDLLYCEGYGISGNLLKSGVLLPMEHAWCCDENFNVIDPTWDDGGSYWGIAFHAALAAGYTAEKGWYGLFCDGAGMVDEHFLNAFNNGELPCRN